MEREQKARNVAVTVTLTAEQFAAIKAAAETETIAIAAWIRRAAIKELANGNH